MPAPPITASRAIERSLIADRLRAVLPGELAGYDDLSRCCGIDVRDAGRHALRAARFDVMDDDSLVFEAIPNTGLRRLTAGELATEQPERRRRRVQRQTQLALREMNTITLAELSNGERVQFNARLAHLTAVALITTHRALKQVINLSAADSPSLPVEQTLAALRGIK